MFLISFVYYLFFAVAGADLRREVDLYANMPSKEFLALLLKSKAAEVSVVEVSGAVEAGPEGGSKVVLPSSEAVDDGVTETSIPLVREKDKKRHRDGSSSRPHHSKKLKDHVVHVSSDKDASVSKSGVDLNQRAIVEKSLFGDTPPVGLRVCKNYVDKVIFPLYFLL